MGIRIIFTLLTGIAGLFCCLAYIDYKPEYVACAIALTALNMIIYKKYDL